MKFAERNLSYLVFASFSKVFSVGKLRFLIGVLTLMNTAVHLPCSAQTHRVRVRKGCGFDTEPLRAYICQNNPEKDIQIVLDSLTRFDGIEINSIKLEDCRSLKYPVTALDDEDNLSIMVNAAILKNSPRWKVIAMLVHELGHIYRADYMKKRVTQREELGSDSYAGQWARKAGCTNVELILAAYKNLSHDAVHPPFSQRMDSVRSGWNHARSNFSAPDLVLQQTSVSYPKPGIITDLNIPFKSEINPPKQSKNWFATRLIGLFDRSLDVFAIITPHVSEDDHKKSKDYQVSMHLISTNPLRPLKLLLPYINKVTYAFDKPNLLKPVVESYNIKKDNYGYTITGVWQTVTVNCMIYFKDGSTMPISKTFKIY